MTTRHHGRLLATNTIKVVEPHKSQEKMISEQLVKVHYSPAAIYHILYLFHLITEKDKAHFYIAIYLPSSQLTSVRENWSILEDLKISLSSGSIPKHYGVSLLVPADPKPIFDPRSLKFREVELLRKSFFWK
ncbi:hypothetical protein HI914_02859 [Erysiphe necator]|nr:hypothetical protein HI914_02859 [Erysiphe necator]